MDSAGCPSARLLTVVICLISCCGTAAGSPQNTPDIAHVRALSDQQRWQSIIDEAAPAQNRGPDLNYFYGIALAQLGRYAEARGAFLAGYRQQPADKRFPLELAGVAFKEKHYGEAKRWLHRALKLDPRDAYANDFLATTYFLEHNLEAALKYWNRADKPKIQSVIEEPQLRINPALLDRAFAFAPASVLRLPDLLTSEARVEGLGVFSFYRFELNARDQGDFDVVFRATENNGWGVNKWQALISTFRGIAYQTIYPEYFNLSHSAINITSLVRWDAQKRRLGATVSGPLRRNPKFRWDTGFDLRNENWHVVTAFTGPATLLAALNLRREAVHAGFQSFNRGSWGWSTGAEISHRDYRDVFSGLALTPDLLLTGYQLKQVSRIHATVVRIPQHRFFLTAAASEQGGRIWSQPAHAFFKLQGTGEAHWFPRSQSNDYETSLQFRAGKTFGSQPFDELFMLGLERDNDLWMRAHIGTRDGRKGSAPLGSSYFLSNWEINKNLYDNGLFGLRISPFLDHGKISDPRAQLGSHQWLWDTGAQLKFSVLSVGLAFTYGKDLRTGANAFYLTTTR